MKLTPYQEWIADLERKAQRPGYELKNRCQEACIFMRETFPELRLERGKIELADGSRWCHWWLVAPDSSIVDPTVSQFPAAAVGYKSMDEEDPKPTGQCWNCRDYTYGRSRYCSPRCGRQWRKDNPGGDMAMLLDMLGRMRGAHVEDLRQKMQPMTAGAE